MNDQKKSEEDFLTRLIGESNKILTVLLIFMVAVCIIFFYNKVQKSQAEVLEGETGENYTATGTMSLDKVNANVKDDNVSASNIVSGSEEPESIPQTVAEVEDTSQESAEGTDEFLNSDDVVNQGQSGVLAEYDENGNRIIDPAKPMIALTFDDGPYYNGTERLLDILDKYKVRATFFVIGRNVDAYPDLVKREVELGCEIGNHTYDHIKLTKISDEEVLEQISKTNDAIMSAAGVIPSIIRPVGGNTSDTLSQLLGIPIVLWSVDTRDWESRDTNTTVENVLENVQDGSIVIMHDVYDETAAAVDILIPQLLQQGYQFVTVSELAEYKGIALNGGQVYKNFSD